MKQELCQFNHVSIAHSPRGVLDNVSFTIYRGDRIALLGTRESGISLIAEILGMQIRNVKGVTWFTGEEGANRSHPRYFYISSRSALMPDLTVSENIYIVPWLDRADIWFSKEKVENAVASCFAQYGVRINHKSKAGDLSEFEKMCVQIMKAVISDVEILVLDTMTMNLTQQETMQIDELIGRIPGMTVVYCALPEGEIHPQRDRVFFVRDGSLLQTMERGTYSRELIDATLLGPKQRYEQEKHCTAVGALLGELALEWKHGSKTIALHEGERIGLIDQDNDLALDALFGDGRRKPMKIIYRGKTISSYHRAVHFGFGAITNRVVQNDIIPGLNKHINIALLAEMKFGLFRLTHSGVDKYIFDQHAATLPTFENAFVSATWFDRLKIAFKRWEAANPKCLLIEGVFSGLKMSQRKWLADSIARMTERGTAVVCIFDYRDEALSKWFSFDTVYQLSESTARGDAPDSRRESERSIQ